MANYTTTSFRVLHERNDAALLRNGIDAPGGELAPARRGSLLRLIADRARICDLQTTQQQREQYGIERWHRDYVRLSEVTSHANSRLEGAALQARIWAAVPNSRFKRFQQLFSHRYQYIVPRFELDGGGRVRFLDRPDFNRMSLAACLVAADRIPDRLAEDLGLADFSRERRRPRARLEKKAQLEAINALKSLWEAAVPLQAGHHRLLMISPSPHSSAAPALHGSLLYSREAPVNGNGDSLGVAHYPNAYSAQRKTFHEARQYLQELRELTEMKVELETFNRRLDREWRAGAPAETKDALRAEAREKLARFGALLMACENKYKLRTRDLVVSASDLSDKSGKPNVSASMARIVGAISALEARFREMYPKGGFNQQDQMALEHAIRAGEHLLKSCGAALREHGHVLSERLQLCCGAPLSQAQREAGARGVMNRLGLAQIPLERAQIRPFCTFAARLIEKREALEAALAGGDLAAAKDLAVQMNVIVKFSAAEVCFERARQFMAAEETVRVSSLRDFVHRLSEVFVPRQLFPERTVPGYQAPFEALQAGLLGLEQRLAEWAGRDDDLTQRSALYKELRDYLTAFDIEAMARGLP